MKTIKKILLAAPNEQWQPGTRKWITFPYVFGILSAVLVDRHEVAVMDASLENLSEDEARARIARENPDLIGITCMSVGYSESFIRLAELAKEACPDITVVIGGIYPTTYPEALISRCAAVDYAVLGEGELRFPRLLTCIENGAPAEELAAIDGLVYRSGDRLVVQPVTHFLSRAELSAQPLPYYDNLDFHAYANVPVIGSFSNLARRYPYACLMTSRGCPFTCIFCTSRAINGKTVRYRSLDHVMEEIDMLVTRYGVKEIMFSDDQFYLNQKRLREFLHRLLERNYDLEWRTQNSSVHHLDDDVLELMRESGCYQISLSIESGTETGLTRLNKPFNVLPKIHHIVAKARSLGFELAGGFILGTPGETWDEIRQTIRLAEELNLDYVTFTAATPLPRTELFEIVKRDRLMPEGFDYDSYSYGGDFKGFGKAMITTDEFSSQEVQIVRAYEWDRINFSTPEKIATVARMHGYTLEEVETWRRNTRRNLGL